MWKFTFRLQCLSIKRTNRFNIFLKIEVILKTTIKFHAKHKAIIKLGK